MERIFQKSNARYLVYFVFAVFYFWMAAQIPYTLDDWEWGLDISIQHLLIGDINGRYAGNFFEIIMTRSELAKVLIMGSVFFLLPLLMSKASSCEKMDVSGEQMFRFVCANILLLTMDSGLWRQTYGWVAGFANYVISAAFLTAWISELTQVLADTYSNRKDSPVRIAALFAVSVLGQLFLENLAIYCVLLSTFICFVHYKRSGKIPLRSVLMLFGAILGLLITFSSSVYKNLWSTGSAISGIRQLTLAPEHGITGTLYRMLWQAVYLAPKALEKNLFLSLIILILMSFLLIRRGKESAQRGKWILVLTNTVIAVYFIVNQLFGGEFEKAPDWKKLLDLAINGVFYLMIIAETVLLFKDRKWFMFRLLAIWLSVAGVIAPLLATTETGRRLNFTSNFFIILFVIMVLSNTLVPKVCKCRNLVAGAVAVVTLVLMIGYVNIYSAIGACKTQRDGIIADAVNTGADTVVLPEFPFEDYLWFPEPGNKIGFFLEFYGLEPDTEIVIEE